MSRTYKDRPGYRRRVVKNKKLQIIAMRYGEDFCCKHKDRSLSRLIRSRLKNNKNKLFVEEEM